MMGGTPSLADTPDVAQILGDGKVVAWQFFLDHGQYNFVLLVQHESRIFICETYISDSRVWREPGTIKCLEQQQLETTTHQYEN
jgi:hypothetical protein